MNNIWHWISLEDKKPYDNQDCLTKMRHGIIEGSYIKDQNMFHGYYWTDMEWHATEWIPIELVEKCRNCIGRKWGVLVRRDRRDRSKVDSNQSLIVEALREIPGMSVQTGVNDIFVGYGGVNYWFEIKSPDEISKKTNKPYPSAMKLSQIELSRTWQGHYSIVWTLEQILAEMSRGVRKDYQFINI